MSQVWSVNTLGGYMYADELSSTLRHALQPLSRFRQFCDARDASKKAKNKGELFTWNIYSNIGTQGTTLSETNTMPENSFTVYQGTLTVTEAGNAVPFTEKLDNLSAHNVREVVNTVLKNDASKFFEIQAFNEFNKTPLTYSATATTVAGTLGTASTFAVQNTSGLGKVTVRYLVDAMRERNIPGYRNDDYYAIGHPSLFSILKGEIESVMQYTPEGQQLIMRGEIGRYYGVRLIEQTAISKTDISYGTGSAWSGYSANTCTGAFFFGADTVMEGVVVPEEIRARLPGDYGRARGVAWYYLGGFGLVNTGSGTTGHLDNVTIVKWGST